YQASQKILDAEASAQLFAFEQASGELLEAEVLLASAQRGLPVIRTAEWIPRYGSSVESVADLIDAGHSVAEALSSLFLLGEELVRLSGFSESYLRDMQMGLEPKVTFDDLSVETKRAVLQRLSAASEDLDLFAANLKIISEEFELLSKDVRVAPLFATLKPLLVQVEEMSEQLEVFAVVTKLLPSFGGLNESATTLLLFLNNDEIRPGGGFIGSYGVLVADGGDIATLETEDVYTLDDAVEDQVTSVPPYPLTSYNASDKWLFRDANWSPDFAMSAESALELFVSEVALLEDTTDIPVATEVDHVVAFTPTYAAYLLEIVGEITVGGQTFTSENVAELLEYQVQFAYAEDGTPHTQRKEILADLINEMKSRLFSLPYEQWKSVAAATQEALRTKQVVLYSTDASTQSVLDATAWGGRVSQDVGTDMLFVVDANLASLKSDPFVDRETLYELYENASGQWIGRVSTTYTHNGSFDWRTTRYRTYTRLYAPLGSRLLSTSGSLVNDLSLNPSGEAGATDEYEEFGMQVFGAFTAVEPGAQQTLVFEFEVASEVSTLAESDAYALTVLKQIGAFDRALTLELDFGKTLTQATPSEEVSQWGDDVYRLQTVLDQDSEFEVSF
ncbi:MAG: DUF4012 domain-containing protein, partial [bacterium]|nr:DUF4012 domain-containing protein [bacterium]